MSEAPKEIWLQLHPDDAPDGFVEDTTWCVDRINSEDIRYIRADLFEHLEQENARLREELEHSRRSLAFYRKVANTPAEEVKG